MAFSLSSAWNISFEQIGRPGAAFKTIEGLIAPGGTGYNLQLHAEPVFGIIIKWQKHTPRGIAVVSTTDERNTRFASRFAASKFGLFDEVALLRRGGHKRGLKTCR